MEKLKTNAAKLTTFNFYKEKKENELDRLAAGKKQASGLFSLFTRQANESNEKPDLESAKQGEGTPLMNTIKNGIMNRALGVKESISNTIDSGRNLKYFAIFLLIGIFLIFLSTLFLPVIVLSPHKFAWLFSLGSLSIFIGLAYSKNLDRFVV